MNNKKKSLILMIIFFIFIQKTKAIKIINNKNISIKINGSINNNYINKKNNIYENKSSTFKIYAKTKKKNDINFFTNIIGTKDINNNISTNIAYIGIKHNKFGKINYGKNNKVINNTLSYTNIFPINTNKIIKNYINETNNNILTYKKKIKLNKNNPIIKEIIIKNQYQIQKKKKNKNIIQSGWGSEYNFITPYGIELSTSFDNNKYNINKINYFNKKKIKNSYSWSTGIKYNLNKIYLSTTYTEENNLPNIKYINNKIFLNEQEHTNKNISITAKYDFKSGITPIIGYVRNTSNKLEKNKFKIYQKKTDIEKYFNIGLIYNINKNYISYINYKINQNKFTNKNLNEENNFSLGFIYKF